MTAANAPLVSVILPVYNAAAYLRDAIDSVLNQTFSDFELIIVNDGSTDSSAEIIRTYNDKRIVTIDQANTGLATALNNGVRMARAGLIARMDNDDICYPERLQKQFDFLTSHPQTGLLGCAALIIGESGRSTARILKHPCREDELRFALLFNNPFVHAGVMFRKDLYHAAGGYSTDKNYFEDFQLWSSMSHFSGIGNLPDILLKYREVSTSMSRTTSDYHRRVINQAVDNILYYTHRFTNAQVRTCAECVNGLSAGADYRTTGKLLKELLDTLVVALSEKHNLDREELSRIAKDHYFNFRRHYYNSIIGSEDATGFERLLARVKRKFLFIKREGL
jgi:glycosyltransferase involved in cell wall biosynthesis